VNILTNGFYGEGQEILYSITLGSLSKTPLSQTDTSNIILVSFHVCTPMKIRKENEENIYKIIYLLN
jgi:hypothetical protein